MKTAIGLIGLLSFSFTSLGQCNVKVHEQAGWTGVFTANELLDQPEDRTSKTMLRTSFLFNRDLDSVRQMLDVSVKMTSHHIIPRRLSITFKGGETIKLTAESISDPKTIDNEKFLVCNFLLSDNYAAKVRDNEIESIKIEDTRTNKSVTIRPYKGIIKEQVNCVIKKLKEL